MKTAKARQFKLRKIKQATKLLVACVAVFCISLFSAGLYQFAAHASKEASLNTLPMADAIVVLTGEEDRIHSAVELLKAKNGKRLLISGVSNSVSDDTILKTYAPKTTNAFCCIDLDRMALDTQGNAVHTADWAKKHGFKKVIIVTSSYHMPRSLDHLQRTMRGIELIPAQIISKDMQGKSALSIMINPKVIVEYAKFLVTRAHLDPVAKYMWTSLDLRTNS
jgi:uncharacterized SAM-binding protein YcdF (DUF218 family)